MVSTNGHDQQRSICLRLRDVLYPRDAVALSSLNREVRGSTQALLPHSCVSVCGWCAVFHIYRDYPQSCTGLTTLPNRRFRQRGNAEQFISLGLDTL